MTGFSKVAVYRQELPPTGGFAPITWSKVPARRIPLWPFVSIWIASNVIGYFVHVAEKREYWRKGNRLSNDIHIESSNRCLFFLFI